MYLTPDDSAPVSAPTLLLLDSSLGGLALCLEIPLVSLTGLGLAMAASDRALMSRSWSSNFFLASSNLN